MSGLAAPWAAVLRAPWQQRRNQGSLALLYGLGGFALAAVVLGAVLLPAGVAFAWLATTLLATAVGGLWVWLVASLLQQNEPAAARLVPGQVRTLRRVAIVAAALIVAVAPLVALWVGGDATAAAVTALTTAVALVALAWIVRWPALGTFAWLIPATFSRWSRSLGASAAGDAVVRTWQLHPFALGGAFAVAAATLGAWSLRTVLQDGGERHRRAYGQRTTVHRLLRTGQGRPAQWLKSGRVGRVLARVTSVFYRRRLAAVSAQRSGDVLGRALVGLGPTFHWTGQVGAALQFALAWSTIALVLWGGGSAARVAIALPLLGTALTYFAVAALTPRRTLHHTRREQALLALLPGMPPGAALNRPLALRLIGPFLGWWAAGVACCFVLLPHAEGSRGWALTFAMACLPNAALLWRDWSRLTPPTPLTAFGPLLVRSLVTALALAAQHVFGIGVAACAAFFAIVALALLVQRWQRLPRWPGALPAGRGG